MVKFLKHRWFFITIVIGVIVFVAYLLYKEMQKRDFDKFCEFYTEHAKSINEKDQGVLGLSVENAQKLSDSLLFTKTKQALMAANSMPLKERYPMLKRSVKLITGKDWSCPAMEDEFRKLY